MKRNQEMRKKAQYLFDSSAAEDDPSDVVLNHQ